MNLALSDEQEFLREAARGALSRHKTFEAARAALDGDESALPDLWAVAREAGWPGLLIDEAHGGAGLDVFDAMLVLGECGRVLASHALLGHLPATAILDASAGGDRLTSAAAGDSAAAGGAGKSGSRGEHLLAPLASGELRACYLPAQPPSDVSGAWSVGPREGMARRPALAAAANGPRAGHAKVSGSLAWVPDAPGADVYVGVALLDGRAVGVAIRAGEGVAVEAVTRYDATRSLGHLTLTDAPALVLDVGEEILADAWHLAQALIAAESLGSVETALDMSVAYAKERHTFGRAIGSYQAVKHSLTEVLRQLENGRSLLYYAGWARRGCPGEFALAANAARSVAGNALDHAARTTISVHGGIGATWEHDAPLYFRRAQLSRRLLGGTAGASDRVAGELIAQARAA
jgi:alkylation response protein AidB-like acyl-CoA dehydrogenase